MGERVVTVSPYQHGAWSALDAVLNLDFFTDHLAPVNTDAAIIATLLQSGAKTVAMPPELRDRFTSQFAQPYLVSSSAPEFSVVSEAVRRAFDAHLPDDWSDAGTYNSVRHFASFLAEILYASTTGKASISLLGCPSVDELRGPIPPEILLPAQHLIRRMESVCVDLPAPKLRIASEAVKQYKEMIDSDLFTTYVDAHAGLESVQEPKSRSLQRVLDCGIRVAKRSATSVSLRRLVISTMEVSAGFLDAAAGRIPGKLAQLVTNGLSNLLGSEKRVVLYDLSGLFHALIAGRMDQLSHRSGRAGRHDDSTDGDNGND